MSPKPIFLSPPHLGTEELSLVTSAIHDNWVSSVGENINLFEESLQNYLGDGTYALAVNSCTSAIHLGLILLGVGKNDEVIVPSFTFVASVNPVLYVGAKPILVDSEKDTWNMCPDLLREAVVDRIKSGKKPKAIVVVHLYGMPAKMKEILNVAQEFEIPVLEDSAEALGSHYKGQLCGTFGDIAAFSFNGNKIITTSAGGMLICKSQKDRDLALNLATQSKEDVDYYLHKTLGFNYRMSNICAAIGLGQMSYLEDRIQKRRHNHLFYKNIVDNYEEISLHKEPNEDFYSNNWLSVMTFNNKNNVQRLKDVFEAENIESRRLWCPMHRQPLFKEAQFFENGVSQDLFESGICLPSGTNYSTEQYDRIEHVLTHFLDSL